MFAAVPKSLDETREAGRPNANDNGWIERRQVRIDLRGGLREQSDRCAGFEQPPAMKTGVVERVDRTGREWQGQVAARFQRRPKPSDLDSIPECGGIDQAVGVTTYREPRLGTRLRVARAERDLSQEQLARAARVSRQTISSIETGQYCPSTLLALRLARILAKPFEELFWIEGGTDEPTALP